MSLPWDRFTPEPIPVVENLPDVSQPGHLPADWGTILKDAFAQALRESRDEGDGTPSKSLTTADARSRSWRTLLQGLAIDLMFALVAAVATLSGADPFARETWALFGVLVVKTLIQTVVSYVMRLVRPPTIRERGEKMALLPLPVDLPESSKVTTRERDSA